MKKKLERKLCSFIRHKTQNNKDQTIISDNYINEIIPHRKSIQKKYTLNCIQTLTQKNNLNILRAEDKLKMHFSKEVIQKTSKSLKFDRDLIGSKRKITPVGQNQIFFDFLKKQVKFYKKQESQGIEILNRIIFASSQMIEQVYSYNRVQIIVKKLNNLIKQIGSKSIIFLGYCLSAQCFFIYGSFSLAIFYADQALKLLCQKQIIYKYQRQKQSDLYKTITKIFLIKNNYATAKQFGYKYLRKTWFLRNYQKEVAAYDLLGKIYHQIEEKEMSIFFHNRMCRGEKQDPQIIRISNYELQKVQNERKPFPVFQTIQVFIYGEQIFHEMLEDRYRMKNRNFQRTQIKNINHFFFRTHRSPNRNLNTYHILERRMIEEKKSKQLHFIKVKQKNNLKKIISQFSGIIKNLNKQLIKSNQKIDQ